jgi:monofunctional biosynthetic peptidoglycan transglycosylase
MSPHLIRSAVAAEDQRFMEHYGFDFEAMKKAMDYNRQNKTGRTRGASTISQQTAKNVFLWPSRTWIRKGLEAGFTLLIEGVWGKRRIMEVYLNVIEMGPGIYGAEAASRAYFDKSADELSARQAALIVAAFPNPRERSPDQPSRYLKKRARKIAGIARNLPKESYPQP